MPVVCKNTLDTSSKNLASSATSWYEYLSFPTWPDNSSPSCTPSGLHGRIISVVGFLWGKLGIFILSFYCGGWLEVLASSCCSFVSHSNQAEISIVVSLVGCSGMVI
jgi:hypothetical protein